MNSKNKWALSVCNVEESQEIAISILKEQGYRVIRSPNIIDAHLKLSNQDFGFFLLDLDSVGLGARDFVSYVRKKEAKKNMKDKASILVTGSVASVFNRHFMHFDNVKFFELPLKTEALSKKVQSFFNKADKATDNTKKIKAGETLILEGGQGHEMFWILDGAFDIVKKNVDGVEVVLGEANTGELVGEMSFLDNLPRSATIRAKCDSEVMIIPQSNFAAVLDGQPRWFRSLMKTLSQRLREANKKISDS